MVAREQSISFRVPGAAWRLIIPADCLALLTKHAQTSISKREVVGQLFSRDLISKVVSVDLITILPSRWSSYTGVTYDSRAAMAERESLFRDGLHCIGFWHSHPECVPHLSATDLRMAADHALASKNVFACLVFAIVGTATPPGGLGMWLHDGYSAWAMISEV